MLQNVCFIKDHFLPRRSSWGASWVSIRHAPKLNQSACGWSWGFSVKIVSLLHCFSCQVHNFSTLNKYRFVERDWVRKDLIFQCAHIIKQGCTYCRIALSTLKLKWMQHWFKAKEINKSAETGLKALTIPKEGVKNSTSSRTSRPAFVFLSASFHQLKIFYFSITLP